MRSIDVANRMFLELYDIPTNTPEFDLFWRLEMIGYENCTQIVIAKTDIHLDAKLDLGKITLKNIAS